MRTLTGAEFLLTIYTETTAGELVDADGNVTYVVRDGAGEPIDTGSATNEDVGTYTIEVAPLGEPDELRVEVAYDVNGVTRTEDYPVEVVGSRLVPSWLARDVINEDRNEQGYTDLPDDDLARIMREVEDTFTSALGFPPYLKPLRTTVDSKGGRRLRVPGAALPKAVYTATFDGEAIDGALAERFHLVREADGHWPRGRIDLHLGHGWSDTPSDLVRAGYVYARELARKSTLPSRATEVATEGAVFSLATPGSATPTGVPEVDGVLLRYRLRV